MLISLKGRGNTSVTTIDGGSHHVIKEHIVLAQFKIREIKSIKSILYVPSI